MASPTNNKDMSSSPPPLYQDDRHDAQSLNLLYRQAEEELQKVKEELQKVEEEQLAAERVTYKIDGRAGS